MASGCAVSSMHSDWSEPRAGTSPKLIYCRSTGDFPTQKATTRPFFFFEKIAELDSIDINISVAQEEPYLIRPAGDLILTRSTNPPKCRKLGLRNNLIDSRGRPGDISVE